MQVFSHMKAAAKNDSACAPNVITYSALMTACCAGGRPDKAYELFRSMPTQDIRPDHICYSTLIAGGRFSLLYYVIVLSCDQSCHAVTWSSHAMLWQTLPACLELIVTARRTELGNPLGIAASAIGFTLVDGFLAASTVVLNLNPAENNCEN